MVFVTNAPLLCTNNTGCILFNSAFFATVKKVKSEIRKREHIHTNLILKKNAGAVIVPAFVYPPLYRNT